MHPVQVPVLIALLGGTIIYIWYRIRRDIRAEREFFRSLVAHLSNVLLPRGLRLTQSADFSKSIGHTIATFEGPVFSLEVFWDYVEREVILRERGAEQPRSAFRRIASGDVPHYAKPVALAKAEAVIVEAAVRNDGSAYLTPARFEVRDVFEFADRGRAVSGTILAGTFRMGARVWAEHELSISFTISGVEFADDFANQRAWVVLVSEDAPPLTELRPVLSPGSILTDAEPVADRLQP
jgi:Holliday junction resolvase